MLILLTTKDDERVIVNTDHVIMICEAKKGPFVVFDDESSFYCKEDFDKVVRKVAVSVEIASLPKENLN